MQVQVLLGAPEKKKKREKMKDKTEIVKNLFLYLTSIAGVLMIIFGVISASNALINIVIPQYGQENEPYNIQSMATYNIQSMARSVAFIISGLLIFFYHWRLARREKENQKMEEKPQLSTNMNFGESIFFYSLSFIGIMISSFAFASLLSGFFWVEYPVPTPENAITVPFITKNLNTILNSIINFLIGVGVWLFSWMHVKRSYPTSKEDEA